MGYGGGSYGNDEKKVVYSEPPVMGTVVQMSSAQQPVYGNVQGQPMMGQPMMGQPMMGQPMMGQPILTTGSPRVPAPGRWLTGWCCPCGRYAALCLCGWCCPFVLVGQMHERLIARGTCWGVGARLALVTLFGEMFKSIAQGAWECGGNEFFIADKGMACELAANNNRIVSYIIDLIEAYFYLSTVIKLRRAMRKRDAIESEAGPCGNECCTSFWCMSCVLCQMFTHDNALKHEHPGYPCGCDAMGRVDNRQPYPLVMGEMEPFVHAV